ncbi:MAG: DUF1552 domain-containing protein [Sandaracinaceae bacterium]
MRELKAKRNPHFARRSLLRGLGAAAALSPFVPLLNAGGQEPTPPRRLVHVYFPHGTHYPLWRPAGVGSDFALSPILAPLERHKDKLLVLSGVDIQVEGLGSDHHIEGPVLVGTAMPLLDEDDFFRQYPPGSGMEDYSYGWNSGPSFDQVIAQRLATQGIATPFRSLEYGVRPANPHPGHRVNYAGPRTPVSPESDPHAMFARMFGPPDADAAALERLKAERRSVLDLVGSELTALEPRVSMADRYKLQAHLQAVRDIETGLETVITCEGPDIGEPINPNLSDNIPIVLERQMDLMAAALACDLTRVMTLQYSCGSNDNNTYRWPEVNVTRLEHHLITHERTEQAYDDLRKIYSWYMDRLASLCDRLAAIPEGDGTVLDHTTIVVTSEIGAGWNHSYQRVPFLLLGGANGYFRMGRHLDHGGVAHNRLLVSLFHAMGFEDVATFGTDTGSGPLPDLV